MKDAERFNSDRAILRQLIDFEEFDQVEFGTDAYILARNDDQ